MKHLTQNHISNCNKAVLTTLPMKNTGNASVMHGNATNVKSVVEHHARDNKMLSHRDTQTQ